MCASLASSASANRSGAGTATNRSGSWMLALPSARHVAHAPWPDGSGALQREQQKRCLGSSDAMRGSHGLCVVGEAAVAARLLDALPMATTGTPACSNASTTRASPRSLASMRAASNGTAGRSAASNSAFRSRACARARSPRHSCCAPAWQHAWATSLRNDDSRCRAAS